MFAVIMQQATVSGIQQVIVVPTKSGTLRQWARDGKNLRGTAGAWREFTGPPTFEGMAIGDPKAVLLKADEDAVLLYPVAPTTLLQRLGKLVKYDDVAGSVDFGQVYKDVLQDALDNPALLAKWLSVAKAPEMVAPTVIPWVTSAPAPIVAEVEAPTYHQQDLGEALIAHAQAQVPVASYSTVAESTSDAHAVLTIPVAEPYFGRKFFGNTEVDIYDKAVENDWNVLLTGSAGTGKTSSARNYAVERNLPFVTIECTQQIDQSITQGRFVPTGVGNSTKWKYSQLATAIQQPSVILINELTRMTPKAASLFLRLLSERELLIEPLNEVIKVHPGVIFIADQNTGSGYTGTSKQDAALIDRFNIKLEFTYDTSIESKFIKSSTLLTFADSIRQASEINDEFSVPMSTRLLKNFVSQAPVLGFEFAVNSMLSNFPKMDGERDAIKMRFDAESSAIASELGITVGSYSTL